MQRGSHPHKTVRFRPHPVVGLAPIRTTIIAAEKTGHRAGSIELNPKYVDVAVRRWERYTGKTEVLDGTGQTFEDVEAEGTAANDSAVAGKEVA